MENVLASNHTLDMNAEEFRQIGHDLVDRIAFFLERLPNEKVTRGEDPEAVRKLLNEKLPQSGQEVGKIVEEASSLLFDHSLFNGHPRFWGYITSSAAPIGSLAEMLASAVNPNVGAFILSPIATEIELQTIRWLAELIGYDQSCGGLFVSGGNMANFVGFLSARKHMMNNDVRKEGLHPLVSKSEGNGQPNNTTSKRHHTIYCAIGTHTWVQKAADLFGFGTDAIRWIPCNQQHQIDVKALTQQIDQDTATGHHPFLVIGNAGSVAMGVVDPLDELARICKDKSVWFHIDGAYGAPAAALPENRHLFYGVGEADSIAIDPHKWLYSPLEAGCILIKQKQHLHDTFRFTPDYYNFRGDGQEPPVNFHEWGLQNSRGFKALKVWMSLKQTGKAGLIQLIRKDILLAKELYELVSRQPILEAVSHNLSITTFRFIPPGGLDSNSLPYINTFNERLLNRLQKNGDVFLSNAVVNGKYCLRACMVNFRTTSSDIRFLVDTVLREGMALADNDKLRA